MKIEDINEPNAYHYERRLRGVTISGTGTVVQKYRAGNGWQIIIHDKRNRRAPTLRPAHILRRVRAR
jgi:hypothetical protein